MLDSLSCLHSYFVDEFSVPNTKCGIKYFEKSDKKHVLK